MLIDYDCRHYEVQSIKRMLMKDRVNHVRLLLSGLVRFVLNDTFT